MTQDQPTVPISEIDLSVDLSGVTLRAPVMMASGVLGANAGVLLEAGRRGAAAVVTKSIGPEPRPGHKNPCFIEADDGVFLNAMGLNNPGCEAFLDDLHEACAGAVPVVASIFGHTPEQFERVAEVLGRARIAMFEVNVSCPHAVPGSRTGFLGQDAARVAEVIRRLKAVAGVPVMVKLTPNVTSIVDLAAAAVEAGADALCAINTVQALEIDPFFEKPVLANRFGGQSGPSVRCIALRKVADLALAMRAGDLPEVPIVGVGGVRTGQDAARFILAGATAVQIGSAVYYDDMEVFAAAARGLAEHMAAKGYRSVEAFRGNALRWFGD